MILTRRRRAVVLVMLAVGVLLASALALFVGPDGFGLPDANALRAPRILLAAAVGAALATSGAVLQGLLRNPLADPYIIGVSGGAALGGALAIALGAALSFAVEGAALVGAVVTSAMLAWLVLKDRSARSDATLLAGVVFNAFAAAAITLIKTLMPAERAYQLLYWLVGTIGYVDMFGTIVMTVLITVLVVVLTLSAGRLELLSLGDDEAARLGVDVRKTRFLLYVCASAMVGIVVPSTGMIGFVGLVVPHALRLAISGDYRLLVPASALFGALVLIAFDAAARASFWFLQTELPTGALTAIVGAPIFGALLLKRMRR